jgi:hypothetical protein
MASASAIPLRSAICFADNRREEAGGGAALALKFQLRAFNALPNLIV